MFLRPAVPRATQQGCSQPVLRQQYDTRTTIAMMMVVMPVRQAMRRILIFHLRPVMLGIMRFFGGQGAEQHMRMTLRRASLMLDAVHRARQAHPCEQQHQRNAEHRSQA